MKEGDECTVPWEAAIDFITVGPECKLVAFYDYRRCSDDRVDVCIWKVYVYGCDMSDADIIQECLTYIFVNHFPPSADSCQFSYQAIISSCWSSFFYDKMLYPYPEGYLFPINEPLFKVRLECIGMDCCYQKYKVCNIDNEITIIPIDSIMSMNDCNGVEYPDFSKVPPGYYSVTRCLPTCDYLWFYRWKKLTRETSDYLTCDTETNEIKIVESNDENSLNLRLNLPTDAEINYKIVNLLGDKLDDGIFKCNQGLSTKGIDISNLPKGVYFIYFSINGSYVKTIKFIK